MGSKGSDSAPAVTSDTSDNSDMLAMLSMMSSMSAGSQPSSPTIEDAPAVVSADEVDWTQKSDELATKAKADYEEDAADRKGRVSTMHAAKTDDEDPITSASLLGDDEDE